MISRVVPRPEPDPLVIVAEDYNEWTARAEAFRGRQAGGAGRAGTGRQPDRRGWNASSSSTTAATPPAATSAFIAATSYIHEAVADPVVAEHVLGALDELGAVVQRKWGFSAESIDEYKQDLCRRGAVAEMRDEILRVVRDPIRKLSPRERLVAPANLAVEYGLPRAVDRQGDRRGLALPSSARSAVGGAGGPVGAARTAAGPAGRVRDRRRFAPGGRDPVRLARGKPEIWQT